MSAFVVDNAHIDALVTYAGDHHVSYYLNHRTVIDAGNASEIGQKLLDENVRSVNYRYRETDKAERYEFKRWTRPLQAITVIKAIECLDYQSCETDDWRQTEAFAILQAIKDAAIENLPGYKAAYDAAPWGMQESMR
jgi:hypothetical protein